MARKRHPSCRKQYCLLNLGTNSGNFGVLRSVIFALWEPKCRIKRKPGRGGVAMPCHAPRLQARGQGLRRVSPRRARGVVSGALGGLLLRVSRWVGGGLRRCRGQSLCFHMGLGLLCHAGPTFLLHNSDYTRTPWSCVWEDAQPNVKAYGIETASFESGGG